MPNSAYYGVSADAQFPQPNPVTGIGAGTVSYTAANGMPYAVQVRSHPFPTPAKYTSWATGVPVFKYVPFPGQPISNGYDGPNPNQVYPNFQGPGSAGGDPLDPSPEDDFVVMPSVEPKAKAGEQASTKKPFCIVMCPEQDPRKRYGTEESARLAAEKSAKTVPGREYIIMKAVGRVYATKPEVQNEAFDEAGEGDS